MSVKRVSDDEDYIVKLEADNRRLTAQVEELLGERDDFEDALRFYANEDNWSGPTGAEMVEEGCYFSIPAHDDRGERARAALPGREK